MRNVVKRPSAGKQGVVPSIRLISRKASIALGGPAAVLPYPVYRKLVFIYGRLQDARYEDIRVRSSRLRGLSQYVQYGMARRTALRAASEFAKTVDDREHDVLLEDIRNAIKTGRWSQAAKLLRQLSLFGGGLCRRFISDRYEAVFVLPPKAASSSMSYSIRRADPECREYKVLTDTFNNHLLRTGKRGYKVIGVIRDPMTRTASCWNDIFSHRPSTRSVSHFYTASYMNMFDGMSFAEFCRWLSSFYGSDAFANPHWLSQSRMLVRHDGSPVDILIRCETLEDDWRHACRILGMPCSDVLELHARARYEPADARALLTEDEQDGLYRRFEQDYRLGSYAHPWK